jgi:ABC-type xylose transport system permease subunit
MTNRKKLFISLLSILLLPIAIAAFYQLVHGTLLTPSKVDLITFGIIYTCAVPIGIVFVIIYYKNRK